jgi:nucleotide-binding universal stress UspA family protein
MIAIRTVLCPVDFSPATPRQVDLGADLARAFGAGLVLYHNVESLGIGASVGWMRNADRHDNPQATAEARLRECLTCVPDGVSVEPLITQGPNSSAVLMVADAIDADLVLLTAHGTMSEDHASITEQMLERGHRAVLVLHDHSEETRTPQFASRSGEPQVVIAATDLAPGSRSAMEVGFDLARKLPIELHLLHVLPKSRKNHAADAESAEKVRSQLRALVPEDVGARAQVQVDYGHPAEGIARVAQQLSAACIVMGEHTRNPLRRLFRRDTPREVLHQARCPVWYVPTTRES